MKYFKSQLIHFRKHKVKNSTQMKPAKLSNNMDVNQYIKTHKQFRNREKDSDKAAKRKYC